MGMHECINVGCRGNGKFEMSEKDEEWYMSKFGDYPKSCPECRKWKKEQSDFEYRCHICYERNLVTVAQIIGFHKYQGRWETPTVCKLCENPDRAHRIQLYNRTYKVANYYYHGKVEYPRKHLLTGQVPGHGEKARRQLADAEKYLKSWIAASQIKDNQTVDEKLKELSGLWRLSKLDIATNSAFYTKLPHAKDGNRFDHIFKKHDVELKAALGVKTSNDVLHELSQRAIISDTSKVIDFRDDSNGYMVKYDMEKEVVMIIHDKQTSRDHQPPPPPAYIITAYQADVLYVGRKISGNSSTSNWVPNIIS